MDADDVVVKVADFRVGCAGDVLVTYGLGSCVAVVLHDPKIQVGGLAHILLPTPSLARRGANLRKFPQTAIPAMLEEMAELGASPRRITARLIGGASMFAMLASGAIQMGERNIISTQKTLGAHRIPIVGEAVGGDFGRTVRLHVDSGVVEVSSVRTGVERI
ncbi:MAG: chemotaxis protein CheD [Gemmatimonadales bacterium]